MSKPRFCSKMEGSLRTWGRHLTMMISHLSPLQIAWQNHVFKVYYLASNQSLLVLSAVNVSHVEAH